MSSFLALFLKSCQNHHEKTRTKCLPSETLSEYTIYRPENVLQSVFPSTCLLSLLIGEPTWALVGSVSHGGECYRHALHPEDLNKMLHNVTPLLGNLTQTWVLSVVGSIFLQRKSAPKHIYFPCRNAYMSQYISLRLERWDRATWYELNCVSTPTTTPKIHMLKFFLTLSPSECCCIWRWRWLS